MQDHNVSRRHSLRLVATLQPFVQRHRILVVAWLVALLASSSATLTLPFAIGRVIDHGFASRTQMNHSFIVLLIVAVALALATAARFYAISLLGEKIVKDLRHAMFQKFLSLDLAYYDRFHSATLVSHLSSDCEIVRSFISATLSVALRSILTVVGSLVMIFVTSVHLALLALITIPLTVIPIFFGARNVRRIARDSQERLAVAQAMATETLSLISTVQAYVRESHESQRYEDCLQHALHTGQQRIRAQAWVTARAIFFVFAAIIGVLWIGAHEVIAGHLSSGDLGQFVLYASIGGGSISSLAEFWNEFQRATGGLEHIGEVFNTPSALIPTAPIQHLQQPVRGEIQLENVHFAYPQRQQTPALNGISFRVNEGEVVAIVGPSGAGKSTLFTLLMRFYDPDRGTIFIDGKALRSLDSSDVRRHIAVVPQHPGLFATSLMDNIRYGDLEADAERVHACAQAANVDAFIQELPNGYGTILGERGASLSGGQQQRIAIARALIKNAPVLLLDEATSALDAKGEHAVQQALARAMARRTTLIIAHRLATVQSADRILVMDKGRIVAEGTHAQLMADGGLYAELARMQFLAS